MPSRLRQLVSKVARRVGATAATYTSAQHKADEYCQRLVVSVSGMTEPGNIAAFDRAIAEMPDGAVVEIGVFAGQSTLLLDHFLLAHSRDAQLFSTDIWVYFGTQDAGPFASAAAESQYLACVAGRADLSRADYMTHIKQRFLDNCRFYAAQRLPAAFDMSSDALFEAWSEGAKSVDLFGQTRQLGGPIAFAYIDGDHSYVQARADVENAAAHMTVGSLMLLDDSEDGCWMGSAKVAQELRTDSRFELLSASPNYMFRKK